MNATLTAVIVSACLCGAVLFGIRIRALLPQHHLNAETKDAVKVAMGLVATMSALLLGLLISSAKDSYDTVRSEVIQMSAKVTLLNRALGLYGVEAAPLRGQFHAAAQESVHQMWSPGGGTAEPDTHAGDALYAAIQTLNPQNDAQRILKDHAAGLAVEIAHLRTLLHAQSLASISQPLLVVVVCWLMIIFFSFTLFAPSNGTATLALLVSALSVAGAIFLILEMDQPFTGLIQISSEPMVNALQQLNQ